MVYSNGGCLGGCLVVSLFVSVVDFFHDKLNNVERPANECSVYSPWIGPTVE